jgi:hypothetical protein
LELLDHVKVVGPEMEEIATEVRDVPFVERRCSVDQSVRDPYILTSGIFMIGLSSQQLLRLPLKTPSLDA